MKLAGWTQQFWETYGQLKQEKVEGDEDSETFTDYVSRKALEEMEAAQARAEASQR